VGGKGGGGGRGEKWTKPCMHIWIIKEKWKKNKIIHLGPVLPQ
jgi:predicted glycosyltransferase